MVTADPRADDLIRRNHDLIAEARPVCQAIYDQTERARTVRYQFQAIRLRCARRETTVYERWGDNC